MKKMVKVIESNVAELIMIGVFLAILMSSCGGSKCIYKKDWRKSNEYRSEVKSEVDYHASLDCCNCDEID
tara:strand:+ start:80 stop:289 length:210 start_codon:yes stop_codon:yes gene_type:complete